MMKGNEIVSVIYSRSLEEAVVCEFVRVATYTGGMTKTVCITTKPLVTKAIWMSARKS